MVVEEAAGQQFRLEAREAAVAEDEPAAPAATAAAHEPRAAAAAASKRKRGWDLRIRRQPHHSNRPRTKREQIFRPYFYEESRWQAANAATAHAARTADAKSRATAATAAAANDAPPKYAPTAAAIYASAWWTSSATDATGASANDATDAATRWPRTSNAKSTNGGTRSKRPNDDEPRPAADAISTRKSAKRPSTSTSKSRDAASGLSENSDGQAARTAANANAPPTATNNDGHAKHAQPVTAATGSDHATTSESYAPSANDHCSATGDDATQSATTATDTSKDREKESATRNERY